MFDLGFSIPFFTSVSSPRPRLLSPVLCTSSLYTPPRNRIPYETLLLCAASNVLKVEDATPRHSPLFIAGHVIHTFLFRLTSSHPTPRFTRQRYPKIVEDLSNWQTRSVSGSNGALLVAAESSTISWGTSVAGELG